MNYKEIFEKLYPGFFSEEGIRSMPREHTFTELVKELRADMPDTEPLPFPEGITFGGYSGGLSKLKEAVAEVDGWGLGTVFFRGREILLRLRRG